MKVKEAEALYHKYFAAVYSICFLYMKNEADACDMVQETKEVQISTYWHTVRHDCSGDIGNRSLLATDRFCRECKGNNAEIFLQRYRYCA